MFSDNEGLGMSGKKYIDAEVFKRDNERLLHCDFPYLSEETLEELIDNAPAADVAEVRHGRWEWNNDDEFFYSCSNCGHKAYGNTNEIVSGLYAYCPNCGAKMEGEQNG